jgi:hypothetical protein
MNHSASTFLEESFTRSTNSMVQLIKTYLLQNKSISIPGLGTIYVERTPAQTDFVNRRLLPPSYHFRFDKYFDAPGKDFFTFLAARNRVEDYEAIKIYNEWALQLRNNISTDNATPIQGVGSLKRDVSGEIIFESSGPAETFHLPVPAERIIRTNARHTMLVGDREVTNVEMSYYLHDENRNKKNRWWIAAVVIAIVALLAIVIHFSRSGAPSPFGNGQTINVR